jgi:hypothetical protein
MVETWALLQQADPQRELPIPRDIGLGVALVEDVFPELSTVAEIMPGYEAAVWFGLFAPLGTPQDVVARINAEVQKVLANPEFRTLFLIPNFYELLPESRNSSLICPVGHEEAGNSHAEREAKPRFD